MEKQYNKIILITAPSGSGKTSIVNHLMKRFPSLEFSVSATTRKPRKNEKDGKDYYFISEEDFKEKIHKKEFLEWEMVYEGKYYEFRVAMIHVLASSKEEAIKLNAKDHTIIFEIFPEVIH